MATTRLQQFYDRYHQKNDHFHKLIRRGNTTYWYILQLLHKAVLSEAIRGEVLDVGCGVGTLSLYVSQFAQSVVGIDVSGRAIEIAESARASLDIKNVVFKKAELESDTGIFDLIICSEVLEHIPDDKGFLKLLRGNLKSGGYLLLTTPSRENLLYKLGYYARFDAEVGHERRYSETELLEKMTAAGFEYQLIRSVEGPLRNILFTSRLGFLLRFIRGPITPIFHWFDALSARLFGASDIQVIARAV